MHQTIEIFRKIAAARITLEDSEYAYVAKELGMLDSTMHNAIFSHLDGMTAGDLRDAYSRADHYGISAWFNHLLAGAVKSLVQPIAPVAAARATAARGSRRRATRR